MLRGKNSQLTAKIVKGVLVISVGIETLKFAIQQYEIDRVAHRNEIMEESGVTSKDEPCKIINAKGFAEDFASMCLEEEEDGSTKLGEFMDSIGNDVIESGSEHIDYPE